MRDRRTGVFAFDCWVMRRQCVILLAVVWVIWSTGFAQEGGGMVKPDWKPTSMGQFFGEFFDIAPVDDADLQPVKVDAPDEGSSYYEWLEFEGLANIPSDLRRVEKGSVLTEEQVMKMREALEESAEALERYEELIFDDSFAVPAMEDFLSSMSGLKSRTFASWMLLRSKEAAHRKDWAALFASYRRALDAQQRVTNASPSLIDVLIADSVEGQILEYLAAVLPDLDEPAFAEVEVLLGEIQERPRDMKEVMKREYYLASKLLRLIEEGGVEKMVHESMGVPNLSAGARLFVRTFCFKEHRMRAAYVRAYRQALLELEKPIWEVKEPKLGAGWKDSDDPAASFFSMVGSVLRGNVVGDLLLETTGSVRLQFTFRRTARLKLARVLVAVQKLSVLEGVEVDVLDAEQLGLTEEDLLDPFSGQTLLYDAERGKIWSVGEDGVDDGGEGKARRDLVVEVRGS